MHHLWRVHVPRPRSRPDCRLLRRPPEQVVHRARANRRADGHDHRDDHRGEHFRRARPSQGHPGALHDHLLARPFRLDRDAVPGQHLVPAQLCRAVHWPLPPVRGADWLPHRLVRAAWHRVWHQQPPLGLQQGFQTGRRLVGSHFGHHEPRRRAEDRLRLEHDAFHLQLRVPIRSCPDDGLVDHLLLGLVGLLGPLRRHVHRAHLPRSHHPPDCGWSSRGPHPLLLPLARCLGFPRHQDAARRRACPWRWYTQHRRQQQLLGLGLR